MSIVDFTYKKGGKVKAMSKKHGDILQKLKLGTYQTRDMVAQRPVAPVAEQVEPKRRGRPPAVKPEAVESVPEPEVIDPAPVNPESEQPATESTEPKGEE